VRVQTDSPREQTSPSDAITSAAAVSDELTRNHALVVLDGTTFVLSRPDDDLVEGDPSGYFHVEVRHLGRWRSEKLRQIRGEAERAGDGIPLIRADGRADGHAAAEEHPIVGQRDVEDRGSCTRLELTDDVE
jgi:hypothetical protein